MKRHAMLFPLPIVIGAMLAATAAALVSQKVDEDVILRAMSDELQRSRELRVVGGGDDVPYFFSYGMTDTDGFHVSSVMGSLTGATHNRFRSPTIDVRVGSYDFDDTGHIFSGFYTGSRYDTEWPLDDHYGTLRDVLWLSTDRAYKTALESMARKRAALNSAAAQTEKLPDFSRVEPAKRIDKVSRKKYDESAWTARTVKLSGLFNAVPEVLASSVDLQILEGTTYLVDSEGAELRYDDTVVWMVAKAEGQAPDGMLLRDAVSFQALELDKFAPETALRSAFTGLAESLRALVHAPAGEAFSGPVLFEPQASAQLLAQLLGDNLRVPRKPLAEPGRNVNFLPSELETKIGSRILPDWMDVVDDPTKESWQGKPLAGYYKFDLEGVPAKPVSVIEKGVLKSFLTTRQPVKGFASSNGHARLPGSYGARAAAMGSLFVKANQAEPLSALKKKLIDQCRERGKPYGMLVRKLDYPFSGGRNELQALAQSGVQSGGSVRPLSPPVLVYRVYPDGREELVRGLRFRGVSTRTLRDILAASQETALFDFVNNAAPLATLGGGGFIAPTSVIAPALLFDEIEFELPRDQLPKLPVVPAPNLATDSHR